MRRTSGDASRGARPDAAFVREALKRGVFAYITDRGSTTSAPLTTKTIA
jgi:hypothetical protein